MNDISLLIETSTERGCVALFRDKTLIYHGILPFGLQNSATLFPEIIKAFTSLGLLPSNLKLIMTGIGPGSYTGIRVGAIVAKTLAFALHIPLIGICSLEGFIPKEDGTFASIIDARIGGVYLQTGKKENGAVVSLTAPMVLSIPEAAILIKEATNITTPSSTLLTQRFEKNGDSFNILEVDPDPSQMANKGFCKFEAGNYRKDQQLELLYLR